ncbi:MAG TPA: tail fiber domain-containing protein [Pyrinomonadaceae bacterium]|nr:tail fiber domain-containing protein [Pyrinomonadaceae bacterium]
MSFIRRYASILALSITLTGPAAAQTAAPRATVVPSATAEGLRFTSIDGATEMRLEIYSAAGQRVYDSARRRGSVLDLSAAEAGQAGLVDGSYLFVVTTLDPNGRARKSYGTVVVSNGRATAEAAVAEQLKAAQGAASQISGQENAAAGDAAGAETAAVVAAHDGRDGQITSTSGALTLRTGDAFKGEDREHVRVTPEGRVGVGTDRPEATLDVAGTIRARGGIRFEDGTTLTSASGLGARNTAVSVAADGDTTANASGTGTSGRLPKWMDGAGTLGDSAISEANGNLVVNGGNIQMTASPSVHSDSNLLFMDSNAKTAGFIASQTPAFTANNGPYFAMRGNSYSLFPNQRGALSISAGNVVSPVGREGTILFMTGNDVPRVSIKPSGDVGIGTETPGARLDVAGSLRISGAGSGLVFPDGSIQTTAANGNSGSGGSMSGTSIVSAVNDPATLGFIGDNRVSPNLARLNGANAWTGANVFGAGLSANNSLITNVGNPVNAGDATNKAYTDANFVKFVPGAEQLSVGDANGTAPMINLRGGSTCCSGPGGHTPAWFKVFQNGSFVATGNLGIGVSPMQGKGYRTSWDSYKGAFRSGYADNEWDDATVGFFSWAGGSNSTAEGLYALAFGDTNFARSTSSIAFGSGNEVKGAAGFAAGAGNHVCDTYGVAFGNKARSGGPLLNGKCNPDTFIIRGLAAVAIGYNVTADQDHTTAMGKFASNNGFTGTFIWSDGSAQQSADTFRNTANNEFAARATGGFRFRTNLGGTTGCNLPAGSGVFNCTSSRATKENFLDVNGGDVLARLRKVPVSTWNYIAEGKEVRHLGPMAEDFYREFGLGTNNTSIGVQDLAGVSLAAVKALDERTAELQKKTEEVETLRSKVDTLEQRLAALEQLLRAQGGQAQPRQ